MTFVHQSTPTPACVDAYCQRYVDLFPDGRSFAHFTQLHLGLVTDLPRKTLPAIAKAVEGVDAQALHHFLAYAPWSVEAIRERRLTYLRHTLRDRAFVLYLDQTGDHKKGHTTDYVASQYMSNLGKSDHGIVSVNAYGMLDDMTFPLTFSVFKPRSRLRAEDVYHTKPQLAVQLVESLQVLGFHFSLVLADGLYSERDEFVGALGRLHLPFVVAIRSKYGRWQSGRNCVCWLRWRRFAHTSADSTEQPYFIRELVYGQRGLIRYYQITTDPQRRPRESTWMVMTNLSRKIEQSLCTPSDLRTWIEYGCKQAKNALGWADYRVTDYPTVERWWELVLSAYTLMSGLNPDFQPAHQGVGTDNFSHRCAHCSDFPASLVAD